MSAGTSSQHSVVPASMLRPAATDISGFGGGRGPERAGHSNQPLPAFTVRTAKSAAKAGASRPPSTSEPAYVGGRRPEHTGFFHLLSLGTK